MSNIIINAIKLAREAHKDQFRKYSKRPYITHPHRVACEVMALEDTSEEAIAASYTHDVIEDTKYTYADILKATNKETADMVQWLTKPDAEPGASRVARKLLMRKKLMEAPLMVRKIKLIDRADNLHELRNDFWDVCDHPVESDPTLAFVELYTMESELLLNVLKGTDVVLEGVLSENIEMLRNTIELVQLHDSAIEPTLPNGIQ